MSDSLPAVEVLVVPVQIEQLVAFFHGTAGVQVVRQLPQNFRRLQTLDIEVRQGFLALFFVAYQVGGGAVQGRAYLFQHVAVVADDLVLIVVVDDGVADSSALGQLVAADTAPGQYLVQRQVDLAHDTPPEIFCYTFYKVYMGLTIYSLEYIFI